MSQQIAHGPTPEQIFDCENNVEPARTIAERIVYSPVRKLVDDISHAIEDARDIGTKRANFIAGRMTIPFVSVPEGFAVNKEMMRSPGHVEWVTRDYPPLTPEGQRALNLVTEIVAGLEARNAELRRQLEAEGEHTAAANANIDRLNTEIERVTRRQQGQLMGKE